eukprot:4400275-Alexandrium_andersonii.AAC.1
MQRTVAISKAHHQTNTFARAGMKRTAHAPIQTHTHTHTHRHNVFAPWTCANVPSGPGWRNKRFSQSEMEPRRTDKQRGATRLALAIAPSTERLAHSSKMSTPLSRQ